MASFYSPFFTSGLLSHPSSPSTSSFPRRGSLPSESMYGTILSPTSQSSALYFTVQQHDSSFLSLDLAESAAHSMRSMSLRRNKNSNLFIPRKFTEQQRSPSQLRLRTSRDSLRSLPSPKPAPSSSLPSTPPPSTTAPSPKPKPKSIAVPKLSIKTAFEHPRTAPLPKMTHRVSRSTPTLSLHLPPPLLSLDHISLSLSLNEDDDELIQSDSSTSPTDHSTITTTHHHHHRISFPLPPQHRRSLSSTQRHTHAHRHPRTSLSTVSTGYRACMRMDALAALEGRRTAGCECGICEEEEKVNNENACVKRNFMSMSDDDEDDIDFGDEQDEKGVILLSPSSPTLYYPLSLPEYDQRTASLIGVDIASSPTPSTSSSSGSSEGEGMESLGMKSVWSEDEDEDEDGDGEEEENDGDAQGLFVSPITPIHDKDEREKSWIHLTSPDGSRSRRYRRRSRSRKRVNAMTTTNTPKLASFKSFIDCDFEHRHERSFIEF